MAWLNVKTVTFLRLPDAYLNKEMGVPPFLTSDSPATSTSPEDLVDK